MAKPSNLTPSDLYLGLVALIEKTFVEEQEEKIKEIKKKIKSLREVI